MPRKESGSSNWTSASNLIVFPKERLVKSICPRFREWGLRHLWESLIVGFEPERDRGLLIGALTSQHLADCYMGMLDLHVEDTLREKHYCRYMDHFVVWTDDRVKAGALAQKLTMFALILNNHVDHQGVTHPPPRLTRM